MTRLKDLNFYQLLEVAFDASPPEIHHAYKEMIQLYHEDSLASYSFFSKEQREEILAHLDEAYYTLIDEHKRTQYDQSLIGRELFEQGMQYQGDWKPLSLITSVKPTGTHTALRLRDKYKAMVSSSPVVQEILTQEVLSGEDLKKIRGALGVSLEMITEMARVRTVFLQAIEEDQFERVPSRLFLKSFLRAYAQCLGLDVDAVASRYLKRIHDPERPEAKV